jgi:capsular exopolysaccharide synthesis family protein
LLVLATVGAAAAFLAAWMQPELYQASALLELQDLNENFLDMRDVAATGGGPAPQTRTELQTYVRILGSRSVVEAALSQFVKHGVEASGPAGDLPDHDSSRRGDIDPGWFHLEWIRGGSTTPELERKEAVRRASESLQIRASDSSRVIQIVCDSTDARIAAGFANAVVDEFIARDLRSRWESARQTEDWLNQQLAAARAKLESAEGELRDYVGRHGLFVAPQQHGIEEDKLREFQQALARAQEERAVRQSRHELAGSHAPEALAEVQDDGALRQYEARLIDLRREYAELSSLFTDRHHRVKQVLAQIKALEPVVERERANTISRVHNEYEAAVRREKLLADSYRQQKELVLRQADVAVEYNLLDREVQTARQIYETLLQRVKEAGIASAVTASPARIVDRAIEPAQPYKPNRALSAAMGLLSGMFLGVVFVFLREQADHRLKRPGDAAYHLGVPELGVVYKSARLAGAGLYRGSRLVLRVAWREQPAPAKIVAGSMKAGVPSRIELGCWQRKNSRWAECFRAARTSILFHAGGRAGLKSVVVTSPSPGEGKSTIACNLAIALAETGRRTLLVDADLRRPRLHEIFGLSAGRGLADLLQEAEPPARLPLHGFLRETAVPGLSVLPSGTLSQESPTLLHGERTRDTLRRLEREFDTVVLDAPPLLPVSEARSLAWFAGGAVVVLRLNGSTREQARVAVDQIRGDGSRLLGVVLNAWKPRAGAGGYYTGHYDYSPAAAEAPQKTWAASA